MGSFIIPLSKRHYIPFSFQLIFVWAFDYHHTIPYQTVEEHLFDNRQKLQVSIGNIISFFMFVDWNECWAVCKMIYAPTFAVLNIQIALIANRVSKENIHYSFFFGSMWTETTLFSALYNTNRFAGQNMIASNVRDSVDFIGFICTWHFSVNFVRNLVHVLLTMLHTIGSKWRAPTSTPEKKTEKTTKPATAK